MTNIDKLNKQCDELSDSYYMLKIKLGALLEQKAKMANGKINLTKHDPDISRIEAEIAVKATKLIEVQQELIDELKEQIQSLENDIEIRNLNTGL